MNAEVKRVYGVDQAWGFGLYMIRAVLNGRVDEVIDLAKTNLLR
ncbi:MAG TPA: hypothetical protein VI386_36550 [Candidatus Sulfotelmatobacter sp.]